MRTALRQPYRQFFGTLANQNRIDIAQTLMNKPLSVTQICQKTAFKQATVSRNLGRLERCGFVSVQPNGKSRIYTINRETIRPVIALMHKHMMTHCQKIRGKQHD